MQSTERESGFDALLVEGDGAKMHLLRNTEADLILSSPPYFDAETLEPRLKLPRHRQTDLLTMQENLNAFAHSLTPVFCEMARVLRPDGALILQTKDIRYGGFLLSLAETHRRMLFDLGFLLVTRVSWRKFSYRLRASGRFQTSRAVGAFRTDETEEFLVFGRAAGIRLLPENTVDITLEEAADWACPVWETPGAGVTATHPHQAPPEPVRRLIRLFSLPGELVVDPFAGHATTLIEAARLGRCSLGYEIDPDRAAYARQKIKRSLAHPRRPVAGSKEGISA